jgi:DNA-binding transcriptional MerR regulator
MELLTINAVSQLAQVPAPTLRNWCNRGWVRCYRDTSKNRLFDAGMLKKVIALREKRRGPLSS